MEGIQRWIIYFSVIVGITLIVAGGILTNYSRMRLKQDIAFISTDTTGVDHIGFAHDGFFNRTNLKLESYWIFNLTNPVESRSGSKPSFKILGPFTYYFHFGLVRQKFFDQGNVRQYKPFIGFYALQQGSEDPTQYKNLYVVDSQYLNYVAASGGETNSFAFDSIVYYMGQYFDDFLNFPALACSTNTWFYLSVIMNLELAKNMVIQNRSPMLNEIFRLKRNF